MGLAGGVSAARAGNGGLSGDAQFAGGDFTAVLEFFRSLYADGVIARSTLLVDYRGAANRFVGNKAASLVDGDWRARDFLALPPEKRRYIQLALFPEIAASGLNQSSFVIPGPGWDINALLQENSTEERADWRFVQRLSGREIQEWLPGYRATGLPGYRATGLLGCWAAGLRRHNHAERHRHCEDGLDREPLQKAAAALARATGSAAIDEVFPAEVSP